MLASVKKVLQELVRTGHFDIYGFSTAAAVKSLSEKRERFAVCCEFSRFKPCILCFGLSLSESRERFAVVNEFSRSKPFILCLSLSLCFSLSLSLSENRERFAVVSFLVSNHLSCV